MLAASAKLRRRVPFSPNRYTVPLEAAWTFAFAMDPFTYTPPVLQAASQQHIYSMQNKVKHGAFSMALGR